MLHIVNTQKTAHQNVITVKEYIMDNRHNLILSNKSSTVGLKYERNNIWFVKKSL